MPPSSAPYTPAINGGLNGFTGGSLSSDTSGSLNMAMINQHGAYSSSLAVHRHPPSWPHQSGRHATPMPVPSSGSISFSSVSSASQSTLGSSSSTLGSSRYHRVAPSVDKANGNGSAPGVLGAAATDIDKDSTPCQTPEDTNTVHLPELYLPTKYTAINRSWAAESYESGKALNRNLPDKPTPQSLAALVAQGKEFHSQVQDAIFRGLLQHLRGKEIEGDTTRTISKGSIKRIHDRALQCDDRKVTMAYLKNAVRTVLLPIKELIGLWLPDVRLGVLSKKRIVLDPCPGGKGVDFFDKIAQHLLSNTVRDRFRVQMLANTGTILHARLRGSKKEKLQGEYQSYQVHINSSKYTLVVPSIDKKTDKPPIVEIDGLKDATTRRSKKKPNTHTIDLEQALAAGHSLEEIQDTVQEQYYKAKVSPRK